MNRLALTVAIVFGLLSVLSGQQTPSDTLVVPAGKQVWLNSAPDAIDLSGMVNRSEESRYDWGKVKPFVDVFHYYQGHVLPNAGGPFVGNSYNFLSGQGFFKSLKEVHKIDVSIEVGAIKSFLCDSKAGDLEKTAENAAESTKIVYKAGGDVRYMTIDSVLVGAYGCRTNTMSPPIAGELIAIWMRDVRRKVKEKLGFEIPLSIGDVEPYPYMDIDKHKWYVDAIEYVAEKNKTTGLSHYHLDVDMRALTDYQKLKRDVVELSAYFKSKGIRFGIIMNGEDTDTAVEYAKSLNKRLVVFKSLGLFEYFDNVVVQSWAISSDGRQYLPANVPGDEPYTQTNLAWHVLNCAFDTPGWDCQLYPQPD